MEELVFTISYAVTALLLPPLALGVIRKVKARLQNRVGAPIWQPLLDVIKLLQKDETLSDTASWMFRFAAVFSCAAAIYLALATPWLSPKPAGVFSLDIFMLLYLLAAMRLFTLLAAMDTGSAFGAFAASREATLSFLVEPVSMLTLVALAIVTPSTQLDAIFAFTAGSAARPALWGIAGTAILLASLVELSRMPIDDPTTHLELTMVHEAMLLEASGKNLALFEYANTLKLAVLFGLSAQCYLHAIPMALTPLSQAMASAAALFLVCLGVGVFESLSVKLNWRKAPEFIAYGITLAVVGSIMAVGSLGL